MMHDPTVSIDTLQHGKSILAHTFQSDTHLSNNSTILSVLIFTTVPMHDS